MIREELLERFLRYVKVNTRSDERSETTPRMNVKRWG